MMFGNEKKTVAVQKETTFAKQTLPSNCKMRKKSNDGDVSKTIG